MLGVAASNSDTCGEDITMALLAEEIVEEWLRRNGYFTMRGIKLGVHEIDLLAVKLTSDGTVKCRHLEVQASVRPMSYISRVPKKLQREGRGANSVKRSVSELDEGVREWVHTKFERDEKRRLMNQLWSSEWTRELVLNVVKSEDEVDLIRSYGITIHRLPDIVTALSRPSVVVGSTSGADIVDLIHLGNQLAKAEKNLPDCTPLGLESNQLR